MASSSDDSCSAPIDFDITSSLEESNGKYCFSCERCPLCLSPKRKYYCKYCIRSGDFVHTPYTKQKESFSEKKFRQLHMKRNRLLTLSNLTTSLEEKSKAENIKLQISDCKEKIRLLKLAIVDAQQEVKRVKDGVSTIEKTIGDHRKEMVTKTKRVHRMKQNKKKYDQSITDSKKKLDDLKTNLKANIRFKVQELVQQIFPITRVCFDDPQEDSLNQATISALAEATQTAFVSGRWIYTENSGNVYYKIVEPLLPANGDYSAYSAWVASNRDSVPNMSSDLPHENQAYGISAALTYLCQLVAILSFYLDVWLPHRICYSDFCTHELNVQEFQCKVAKLNANILHLCLLQNVNPESLLARCCAANLARLLDTNLSDLGRFGPMEMFLDSTIEDLNVAIDISNDDDSCGDWEEVNEPELTMPQLVTNQPRYQTVLASEATTSTTGGLMQSAAASFFSIWKAATGQK